MKPGSQFHQLELFQGSDGGRLPASELRNRSVPPGGQLELPMHENVLATRSTTAPAPREKTPDQRLRAGEHPVDAYHGGTYPMFMTGPEIRHQFQALDGDRNDEMYHEDSWNPGGVTIRGTRTAAEQTVKGVNKMVINSDGEKQLGVTRRGFNTGDTIPSLRAPLSKLPETDSELYDRKLDEAYHDEDAWHEDYDVPMPGRGLAERIHEHGYDWNHPVHLPDGTSHSRDYTGGRGTFGKYQVLGGHHRIAVMSEEYPRQFMPVDWHPNIRDAQESPNYY